MRNHGLSMTMSLLCAWVLWQETVNFSQSGMSKEWEPIKAVQILPECESGLTEAVEKAYLEAKKLDRDASRGSDRVSWSFKLKNGASGAVAYSYRCLPETTKPNPIK